MNIYNSITELIGNTKLLYLSNYCKKHGIKAKLCIKLEYTNPAGSIKDRAAYNMIVDVEGKGMLKPGSVIIEPTSGNTGIGLAAIGRARGYRVILTMPDTMSIERRNLLKAYGAEVVLTEGSKGMNGAIAKAKELASELENSFIPDQFNNAANLCAHFQTGAEIWRDTDGEVKAFVAGIGTGGTLSGVSVYLKKQNPDIKIIGVEPASSPMISKGQSAPHKIQGIGANFVPGNFKSDRCDEIICIENDEAYQAGREVAECEGILIGISGGAAVAAARKLAERGGLDGEIIVAIAPDSGEHYLSVPDYLI